MRFTPRSRKLSLASPFCRVGVANREPAYKLTPCFSFSRSFVVYEPERDRIGLPPRIFLYTPDQLATMLSLNIEYVKKTLLFYDVREPGIRPKSKLRAVNIAPEGETPEWRVSEKELIRYLRNRGIKFYERGYGM